MKNDFLKDLEYLGVTARIKRLSDSLTANIKELYKDNHVTIEPSWHLIFLILKETDGCSMVEIAEALRLSQPALTKMVNRMKNKGYLKVVKSSIDKRKKILQLTPKAIEQLPLFEKIWSAGINSVKEILADNQKFFSTLEKFEDKVREKSFSERAKQYLEQE